jgi:hypothetical protein
VDVQRSMLDVRCFFIREVVNLDNLQFSTSASLANCEWSGSILDFA